MSVRPSWRGERLAARGGIDVILTSPLRRAQQTRPGGRGAGAEVVADDDLRETDFGAWEGLTFREARQRWPDEVTAWLGDPEVAPPGGESFAAVGGSGCGGLGPPAGR